jgi:peptide/nickel transport system substrate-binding protein
MDMNDILHSLYFTIEWGTQIDDNDRTFDTEFTPRAAQSIQTIIGVNPIDENTIEVYVNYWHFDEGEIANWAVLWNSVPWEISSAMEKAVIDGKVSFSRSGATSKNVSWLSLIIPNDANIIKSYLQEYRDDNFIPVSLEDIQSQEYYQKRYESSIEWIESRNHAVISNGPFYLESYSPESRTITVKAFDDDSYPFRIGEWSKFEKAEVPTITKVEMKKVIQKGKKLDILVGADNSDFILYFLTNSKGSVISSKTLKLNEGSITINIPAEITKELVIGANNIKVFAMSDSVLKPDFYESSFIVTNVKSELPSNSVDNVEFTEDKTGYEFFIIPIIIVIAVVIYLKMKYYNKP